ncbi:unnamed protein product [Amoebophrya sp. A120]|nr:unnamed protein product [Amoebophrya sp. A120]|eukprot:GSA120T00020986001.1
MPVLFVDASYMFSSEGGSVGKQEEEPNARFLGSCPDSTVRPSRGPLYDAKLLEKICRGFLRTKVSSSTAHRRSSAAGADSSRGTAAFSSGKNEIGAAPSGSALEDDVEEDSRTTNEKVLAEQRPDEKLFRIPGSSTAAAIPIPGLIYADDDVEEEQGQGVLKHASEQHQHASPCSSAHGPPRMVHLLSGNRSANLASPEKISDQQQLRQLAASVPNILGVIFLLDATNRKELHRAHALFTELFSTLEQKFLAQVGGAADAEDDVGDHEQDEHKRRVGARPASSSRGKGNREQKNLNDYDSGDSLAAATSADAETFMAALPSMPSAAPQVANERDEWTESQQEEHLHALLHTLDASDSQNVFSANEIVGGTTDLTSEVLGLTSEDLRRADLGGTNGRTTDTTILNTAGAVPGAANVGLRENNGKIHGARSSRSPTNHDPEDLLLFPELGSPTAKQRDATQREFHELYLTGKTLVQEAQLAVGRHSDNPHHDGGGDQYRVPRPPGGMNAGENNVPSAQRQKTYHKKNIFKISWLFLANEPQGSDMNFSGTNKSVARKSLPLSPLQIAQEFRLHEVFSSSETPVFSLARNGKADYSSFEPSFLVQPCALSVFEEVSEELQEGGGPGGATTRRGPSVDPRILGGTSDVQLHRRNLLTSLERDYGLKQGIDWLVQRLVFAGQCRRVVHGGQKEKLSDFQSTSQAKSVVTGQQEE